MDFNLNFLGLIVADFELSSHFYTAVLGIKAKDIKSDWATFETADMTFALFNGEVPAPPS